MNSPRIYIDIRVMIVIIIIILQPMLTIPVLNRKYLRKCDIFDSRFTPPDGTNGVIAVAFKVTYDKRDKIS